MPNLPLKTKAQAWNREDITEQNIEIKDRKKFNFTRRWFKTRNQCTFSTFLPELFPGDKPINMIQIGVFEGMDLVWQMQNSCKHPDSRVLAIDPWLATTKLDQDYMNAVCNRAKNNLSQWKDQIKIERNYSQPVLEQIIKLPVLIGGKEIKKGDWDLIVIDGDHTAEAVYQDAVLSYALVKKGGLLLFDDVRNRIPKPHEVPAGLTRFLEQIGDNVVLSFYHRFCDAYTKIN